MAMYNERATPLVGYMILVGDTVMRFYRFALGILLITLVSGGCATTAKFEENLDSWLGTTEKELVQQWGPPINVYELDSTTKVLTYNFSEDLFIPGSSPNYTTTYIGNQAYTQKSGGMPAQFVNYNCTVNFTFSDGIISSWRYEGNSCRA